MVRYNEEGLVPAIVQDADTGRVLMMAWMNEESIAATIKTNLVTFWSRSRNELWQKGSTSGNQLTFREMSTDCDEDALLVLAHPTGPACHNGTTACFDDSPPPLYEEFGRLSATIAGRQRRRPEGSYTVNLLDDPELAARKVLEEAGEVAFAAKDLDAGTGDRQRLTEELADLIYHTLVLAAAHEVNPRDIGNELARRR